MEEDSPGPGAEGSTVRGAQEKGSRWKCRQTGEPATRTAISLRGRVRPGAGAGGGRSRRPGTGWGQGKDTEEYKHPEKQVEPGQKSRAGSLGTAKERREAGVAQTEGSEAKRDLYEELFIEESVFCGKEI